MSLPRERQSPGLYSALGVIIPWGAKSDILNCLIIREDPLDPFVELLGKCRQVFRGIELGTPELL